MTPDDIIRVIFGLIAVLGLIGLCALIARKAGLLTAANGLSRKRRLAISESLSLDARRRMVIVKCDDAEHLIILGNSGETIVQNNLPTLTRMLDTDTQGDLHIPRNPFAEIREALAKANATDNAKERAA